MREQNRRIKNAAVLAQAPAGGPLLDFLGDHNGEIRYSMLTRLFWCYWWTGKGLDVYYMATYAPTPAEAIAKAMARDAELRAQFPENFDEGRR